MRSGLKIDYETTSLHTKSMLSVIIESKNIKELKKKNTNSNTNTNKNDKMHWNTSIQSMTLLRVFSFHLTREFSSISWKRNIEM